MREKIKKLISCLVVVCLTVAILITLTNITENKNSLKKYTQFFSQKENFDVLFLGSSKVINGIFPMELWNDYGIVSYNMGGHANTLPTTYWVLRNALDHTSPRCVVIDCFGLNLSFRISSNFYYSHLSFDAFPISPTKIQAVFDLVDPTEEENVQEKRLELLWNFSIYHSRWSALEKNDFSPRFDYQKGAEPRPGVSVPAQMASVSPDMKNEEETLGKEYLRKMIELCQKQGIDVILINLPYPAGENDLIAVNSVRDIAEKYDVQHINFFEENVVDFDIDLNDPASHLNPSGAHKITQYLGQVLRNEYHISDQRENPAYSNWHNDAKAYYQEKTDLIVSAESLLNVWMLLADDEFSFVAELEQTMVEDNIVRKLMRNAGVDPEMITGGGYLVVDRAADTVEFINREEIAQKPVQTTMGVLSGTFSDSEYIVKLNDEICWSGATPQQFSLALFSMNGNKTGEIHLNTDK